MCMFIMTNVALINRDCNVTVRYVIQINEFEFAL